MNLLLDTRVALWAITDNPRLGGEARELIAAPEAAVWISAASLWEIAIKHALGRGDMPVSAKAAAGYFEAAGYRVLTISAAHALAVENLPPHHQDPFDRILVAQALVEPMRLLTSDPLIARYSDTIVEIPAKR